MMWVSVALYALGYVGAFSLVPRDVPAGLREHIIIVCWPLAVAYAVASVPVPKLLARR